MQIFEWFQSHFLMLALTFVCWSIPMPAQTQTGTAAQAKAAVRDGQHDFDFAIGTWKFHLRKRMNPLTGSQTWIEFEGTLVARKVWDGRANIEEVELNSPTGRIEGMTVRLYNPKTQQWSIYWADSRNGSMDTSAQVGQFKDGRGEFYGQDTLNGKPIYVRFVWTNTNSDSPHFEQSYSEDGGKTWEVNWISDQARESEASDKSQ
jgi:hypothetical protein